MDLDIALPNVAQEAVEEGVGAFLVGGALVLREVFGVGAEQVVDHAGLDGGQYGGEVGHAIGQGPDLHATVGFGFLVALFVAGGVGLRDQGGGPPAQLRVGQAGSHLKQGVFDLGDERHGRQVPDPITDRFEPPQVQAPLPQLVHQAGQGPQILGQLLAAGHGLLGFGDGHRQLGGVLDTPQHSQLHVVGEGPDLTGENGDGDPLVGGKGVQIEPREKVEQGPTGLRSLQLSGEFHTSKNTRLQDPTRITIG
ncbi:hypothetical protein Q4V65_52255 [Kutzneria buriramensis]|nr:hypothetical protein [Kutzneria buriramensis]